MDWEDIKHLPIGTDIFLIPSSNFKHKWQNLFKLDINTLLSKNYIYFIIFLGLNGFCYDFDLFIKKPISYFKDLSLDKNNQSIPRDYNIYANLYIPLKNDKEWEKLWEI
jgi:hypothetical protein